MMSDDKIKFYSVNELIEDVNKALNAKAYFSALTLTFSLIAECSKIEFPNEKKDSEKFIKWVDEHVQSLQPYFEFDESEMSNIPRVNGNLLYKLRCSIFHECSSDIIKGFKN